VQQQRRDEITVAGRHRDHPAVPALQQDAAEASPRSAAIGFGARRRP
jgi:hypothetical protein